MFTIYTAGYEGHVKQQVEYSLDGGSSWTDIEAPFDHTVGTVGTLSYQLATHDATVSLSRTQDPSLIQVRATLTVQMTQCGSNCNNVSGANGILQIADIRLDADCTLPTGESSTALGWNPSLPTLSAADFRGNLVAANGANFTGRLVKEESGWDGWDGCASQPTQLLSGGSWPVVAGNTYSPDTIGVSNDYIAYYQQYGSPPCASTETQQMFISCLNSSDFVRYAANSVTETVGATTFSVTRANATQSKTFP